MTAALEVQGLRFGYEGRMVLDGMDLRVEAGERVGLAGANGSGKSTLLWCLAGLLGCQGDVRVFGARPGKASRERIGMVFQNPEDQLFMPTLLDDLALPLVSRGAAAAEARATAQEWLTRFGLGGYTGAPAAHLSLGQRKRAAVALAMIRQPELLMLDEPTAELDGGSVRQLKRLLNGMEGTRLIASHDLGFLHDTTSRVVLLHGGRVRAEGPTGRILNDTALLEEAGLV